ncbi:MAG TPA: SMP-30/gluconolactonase/LRE family protein [Blastocatellia bacterium]
MNRSIVRAIAAYSVLLIVVPLLPASPRANAQSPAQTEHQYQRGPDSKPQPGVPKGEVLKFSFDHSKIFPGTYRDYWIYIPAEYTPDKPACVYVNQDGVQFEAPTVFDNLIYKKEMPVTIGVFVMHGRVRAADPNSALDRFNRSYEYDGLGDNYVRFILDELLPEVETRKATDGRPIRLSHDGNDRAIGGSSSGAICAFTAAWERPDAFTRVFSSIGTYVGLRGGEQYPTLIRKYEPKPIRIFLQDGSSDLNIYAGDWWMANQTMERALEFAGYEVEHVWGEGGHNGNQATAVFPDAMRFLWKNWPQAIKSGESKNGMLAALLISGERWSVAGDGYSNVGGLTVNTKGEVFFTDSATGRIGRIGIDARATDFAKDSAGASAQAFGPDGRLYTASNSVRKVTAYDTAGKTGPVIDGLSASGIVVSHSGSAYLCEPASDAAGMGKIWLIKPDGKRQVVDTGIDHPGGITLSPDQTLLYVNDARSHWVYSFQVQSDGSLASKQRYYWLHVPDPDDDSGAGGMCVDTEGRLYIATRLGVQVCDQAGRVNCILPVPNGKVTSVTLGGDHFDTLYAACGDRIYKRKLNAVGSNAWAEPTKPAAPKL